MALGILSYQCCRVEDIRCVALKNDRQRIPRIRAKHTAFYTYLQRVGSGTRVAEVSNAAARSRRVIQCRF